MTTTSIPEVKLSAGPGFAWPAGFDRIPDDDWVQQDVDQFGLSYDSVGGHGWYKNLEPTVGQVAAALDEGKVLLDYSSGTGILSKRLLSAITHPVGIVNIDASAKFLRVALENFRDDERVAFRLLHFRKDEKRLQALDEVIEPSLVDRGVDLLTSTNAIHLYHDLAGTLGSWQRVLRPGGLVFICSANMRNPSCRPGDWIIDETVAKVNEIAADLVSREPAFAQYRGILNDETRMASHLQLREKVFVPVRELDEYLGSFEQAGFQVLHVYDATIFARVDEWFELLSTYHEGVLSWVGGTKRTDGKEPSEQDMRNRLFLIRYGLEKLFPGQECFPCTWTYLTCRRR